MDELRARHRKELKDLQSQITQKKKSASKKTRKAVNDECDRLEHDLKARHEEEIRNSTHESPKHDQNDSDDLLASLAATTASADATELTDGFKNLNTGDLSAPQAQPKKPNRQKARLARRAAEQEAVAAEAAQEALSLPDLRKQERAKLLEEFEKRGLQEKEVAANGHCMYSSVADQLHQLKFDLKPQTTGEMSSHEPSEHTSLGKDDYKLVRKAAADYIAANPEDFLPFLEEPLNDYVSKIRDTGEWGGQLELLALARTYGINISVLQADGRIEHIEGQDQGNETIAWLAYYRHGFGLGEHYNSLRQTTGATAVD